ncbi:MAG: histidine kinase [Bacteroidia bacterium]|nr:histidine kinase [Bacteroidia bacterium]
MRKGRFDYKSLAATAAVWAGIFIVEALVALWETGGESEIGFRSYYLKRYLLPTLPFLLLYCLHDQLVAPLLVRSKRVVPYLLCTALLLGGFGFYVFRTSGLPDGGPELQKHTAMPPHGFDEGRGMPPERAMGEAEGDGRERPSEADRLTGPPGMGGPGEHPEPPHGERHQVELGAKPIGAEISKILIALMMLGVNLGAKYYATYSLEKKRLAELEKENLKYRLEYLRYQINPHFFMNTLNNIHALVDDAPEKAKDSIVELSRLMRHVLYDSNGPTVSLAKEVDFLRHYLYLMRLRFTDRVRISCSFPEDEGGAKVPPLIMTTITENAFKHGVSYKSDCHIRLSIALEGGRLIFRCANSIVPGQEEPSAGGVGLDNIRKRLSLLYGEDFVLHIAKSADEYEVLMVLPCEPPASIIV